MSEDRLKELLSSVEPSRRAFLAKLLGGSALAAPAIASLSLPRTVFAHTTSIPVTQPPGTGPVPTSAPVPTPPPGSQPPPTRRSGMTTLFATGDTFIRSASRNTNEGANPRLYVSVEPVCRSLVQFDRLAIADLLNSVTVQRAELVLTIATNHNTWGETDRYGVSAHALTEDFVEGNGLQALMPPDQAVRGTGEGATWNSPADPNVADARAPRAPRWDGGAFLRAGGPTVRHVNQMTGPVSFDVTADVREGRSGWLLRISREDDGCGGDRDDDDDVGGGRRLGFEQFRGAVEYYSREGASLVDAGLGPQLVITFD